MIREVPESHHGLALEDLRTLAYAAAFIRARSADSIEVALPSGGQADADALERACELAVAEGLLEAEIRSAQGATTVRFARPGRL